MQTHVEKLPKSSLNIKVTVPVDKVKETYELLILKAVEETEVEGFRKGKAPRDMVLEKVGVSNLHGDLVNALLRTFYPQALKETSISPVSNPKVEINEFDIDKDFTFTATVAVRPEIKVGDYIKPLKDFYNAQLEEKKKENQEKIAKGEQVQDIHLHLSPNEVIDQIVKVSELEVPDLLIEEETDRMLSKLINQAESIGLSLDQYLKSQNKTSDQLREEYKVIAEKNIKAEFALGQIIKEKDIEISDEQILETLKAGGFENAESRMENLYEKLYVKSILQKNKVISDIVEEIEGENHHEHK
jgi:FKBP-type peptidyl-prolyl cis-trans isomerase (trigger factor)